MDMPLSPTWTDIAIRLVLTMLAGGIVGFNRGTHGHAAGLRTTILVGLAAAVAMIQMNLLLQLSGKTSGSFAVMDLMRLPLGILTGVGFIGAGAIFKKGDLVTGVTTAATLWLMTVIGLCFGGGQLVLAVVTTLLAVFTLWTLKWIERAIAREHRARVVVTSEADRDVRAELPRLIESMKFHVRFCEQRQHRNSAKTDYGFEVSWRRPERDAVPPELLEVLDRNFSVKSFEVTTESGG
jgi:putative Mg2+ transporter-C (MgtC) family protein